MRFLMFAAALGVAVLTFAIGSTAGPTAAEVRSLRNADPQVDLTPPDPARQDVHGRFDRAYRLQPPLIPHQIDRYQIDLKANQCLGCHDWSNAAKNGAPTLSMTHYLDRDGRQTDTVAGTRWFCNACHVPQAEAKDLVENTFKPSQSVR
ncbi:nitrate reductase cytochrome c-type subunit [Siculibacillus lacustris]|uniref:Periplasmic nitrate reductase, electron transfer subunit n=1 Tax=Siculibacillus lacustris TaxID=1549641 RepID=A0A4Q9VVL6_9HYPH|nr:nitrate reductase cytochrome c-type subunit [Siculibacillus lacustris]TBW40299.1 nitrate reductase cytochrome c-type subunit [Siculibacillus lacustris]